MGKAQGSLGVPAAQAVAADRRAQRARARPASSLRARQPPSRPGSRPHDQAALATTHTTRPAARRRPTARLHIQPPWANGEGGGLRTVGG
eukprot:6444997-Prymnesium_polylepis.1